MASGNIYGARSPHGKLVGMWQVARRWVAQKEVEIEARGRMAASTRSTAGMLGNNNRTLHVTLPTTNKFSFYRIIVSIPV